MFQPKPFISFVGALLILAGAATGQESSVFEAQGNSVSQLGNADIIQMVQAGYSDVEVLMVIDVGPVDFDFSFEALTALREAGVSEEIRMAMMEAEKVDEDLEVVGAMGENLGLVPVESSPNFVRYAGEQEEFGPSVRVVTEQGGFDIPRSQTHITQADVKGDSLGALAADSAVDAVLSQALTTGLSRASWEASKTALGSFIPFGGMAAQAVGSLIKNRQPKVTFLWALPGRAAEIEVAHSAPVFEVDYGDTAGLDPAAYEPVLVNCLPMGSDWRLIGATRGKANLMTKADGSWNLFAKFSQERVATRVTKVEPGVIRLEPVQALRPGQYSVVLRPLNPTKKFAGIDIASAAGDGMIVNSAWAFAVVSD